MTGPGALRIAVLFPELLGTYGDGGNAIVLRQRLAWRGEAAERVDVALGDAVPGECDLYVLGGGEDLAQVEALTALRRTTAFRSAVDRGVPVFAVCAGMQLLGRTMTDRDGRTTDGLGLLDLETTWRAGRAVGEVVAEALPPGLPPVNGFANHAGRTTLGADAAPLGRVVSGPGNDDALEQSPEGALQGTLVATYLHGPVLARNGALADLVLSKALGRDLPPLALPEEDAVRRLHLTRRPAPSSRWRRLLHR